MNYLFILNDAPYGTERSYNGLGLANSLAKEDDASVAVFLVGDAAACACAGQKTPNGYYNIERMLKVLASKVAKIGVWGSCTDARGLGQDSLLPGARRSSMKELASWTREADDNRLFTRGGHHSLENAHAS